MRKKRNVLLLLIATIPLLLILYYWVGQSIGNKNTFLNKNLNHYISQDLKNFIKETLYKKKYYAILDNYKYNLLFKKESYKLVAKANNLQMTFQSSSSLDIKTPTFANDQTTVFNLTDYKYFKYTNEILRGNGPRSYLEVSNDKFFLMTGTGQLFFTGISSFKIDTPLNLKKIKTNLTEIIGKKVIELYPPIVKDIFIEKEKIYISYIKKKGPNCYYNAIVEGKLNTRKIKFRNFFEMNECQIGDYLSQSGGIISKYKLDSLLYTIGDYRSVLENNHELPQSLKSLRGKIIKINKTTKKSEILSIGHRNPQGLFYDDINDVIISSEHGAFGGCEVNLNFSPLSKIKNFGWPISSYGEHYGSTLKFNEKVKINSPLYKSHSDHGFVEPVIYFNPAIAPSQIINISDFIGQSKNHYLMGSMGKLYSEKDGGRSLHYFFFNDEYKMINHQIIPIGDRVRDLVFSKKHNLIFVFLESSGSILMIKGN